ncbi:MAG TPA: OsmC family peroxiredoxin [candidate division Zixibacteria bacterium]|nr:OsmC family peroxiredoxin [candidate division Zixibacteria bacterium]
MSKNILKAECRLAGNRALIAKSDSGHWTLMDVPESVGGDEGAMHPFEHLFAALAGCTASDLLYVMQKKRIRVDDLRIEIEAQRAETHPKVAEKIHLHYIVVGPDISEDAVAKAIDLSQDKYCSVSAMLKAAAEITHSFEVLTPDEAYEKLN